MFKSNPEIKEICFDVNSVVGAYDAVRELFPNCFLLEASDYIPDENCYSYIAINPIAGVKLRENKLISEYPDKSVDIKELNNKQELTEELVEFFNQFEAQQAKDFDFIANGLFGYIAYDAIEYFDTIKLKESKQDMIPIIDYKVFEFVVAVNNYRNKAYILKNNFHANSASGLEIKDIEKIVNTHSHSSSKFKAQGSLESNLSKEEHEQIIKKSKEHIKRGDVFQIVPSRAYHQKYSGDDFLVYRALRSINPSPYLFYFDFGEFRIFGSSPEADLLVQSGRAYIHPIAGTCPNVEDQKARKELIETLVNDPKENSEHVMLVDLARNDLNKHCDDVKVENYREVQEFSHVIHLVSVVSGQMFENVNAINLLADTFPAGTLTGAPKFKAMELIDSFEPDRREFYGGALGFIDFNGDCVHAIMIRTFLSRNGVLTRRAGGGVVDESVIENEVAEVQNKLKALERAVELAEEMS